MTRWPGPGGSSRRTIRSMPWCCGQPESERWRRPRHQDDLRKETESRGARSGRRCGSRWYARCKECELRAAKTSTSSMSPTWSSAQRTRTLLDSHVSAGLVCALEPIGLMRRVGLGETLRIAPTGNDERAERRHRPSDWGWYPKLLWLNSCGPGRTRSPQRLRPNRRRRPRAPSLRSGNHWTALPSGAGSGADLHPVRQSSGTASGRTRY